MKFEEAYKWAEELNRRFDQWIREERQKPDFNVFNALRDNPYKEYSGNDWDVAEVRP